MGRVESMAEVIRHRPAARVPAGRVPRSGRR